MHKIQWFVWICPPESRPHFHVFAHWSRVWERSILYKFQWVLNFFWPIFGVKEVVLIAFWSCVNDDPQNRDIRKSLCDLIRKPGLLSDALDSLKKFCIILSGTLLYYQECRAKSELAWWCLSSLMCLFSVLDDCFGRSLVRKGFCKWKVSTCRLNWKSNKLLKKKIIKTVVWWPKTNVCGMYFCRCILSLKV